MANALMRIVIGPDGKLSNFWRVLVYVSLAEWVVGPLFAWPRSRLADYLGLKPLLSAGAIAFNEVDNFLIALVCTGILALYEWRRIDSYGLPISRAFSGQTLEGFIAGVVMAGAVGLGMFVLGGMQVKGLALTGEALVFSALAWLGANICVGVAEEFFFRSYFLQTLWKSVGFWPASIAIALLFAADHYFFKLGENIWDVITLVSISLVLSYSVLRTGTLWFAVGFHIAFDYMQLFVIGTPNGTLIPEGRLLAVNFNGPAWLTGGVLGTEASFLMYPATALLWLYVWRRYRLRPAFTPL